MSHDTRDEVEDIQLYITMSTGCDLDRNGLLLEYDTTELRMNFQLMECSLHDVSRRIRTSDQSNRKCV